MWRRDGLRESFPSAWPTIWPARALAAAEGARLETVPSFTGADRELWRIEQLTDGTYRIMPKVIPGRGVDDGNLCLISVADSTPGLGRFDFSGDNCKWDLKKH